jgi:hypothetical protein
MSVASLENGNLTLNSLTISNSQYAEASGYVPSTAVFSSTKNGTAIAGATNISTPAMYITNPTNTNNPYFSSSSNTMNLNVNPTEGLNITSGASYGSIIPTGANILSTKTLNCQALQLNDTNTTGVSIGTNAGNSLTMASSTISILSTNLSGSVVGSGNISMNASNQLITPVIKTPSVVFNDANSTAVSIGTNGGNSLTMYSSTISIFTTDSAGAVIGSGNLSVNASNQLLWNGVVIS